jgi:hypothetical protein
MGCESNKDANTNGGDGAISLTIPAAKGICPAGEKAVSMFKNEVFAVSRNGTHLDEKIGETL